MCDGNYEKDPAFAASNRKIRYVRSKATYFLRGRYRKIGGKKCVYCECDAETGDHVPSLFAGYTNGVVKGVIVSSCYDCNKNLGPFSSTCLKERAAFLLAAYEEGHWDTELNDFRIKNCKKRLEAINCNMIEGSAALFKENDSVE